MQTGSGVGVFGRRKDAQTDLLELLQQGVYVRKACRSAASTVRQACAYEVFLVSGGEIGALVFCGTSGGHVQEAESCGSPPTPMRSQ